VSSVTDKPVELVIVAAGVVTQKRSNAPAIGKDRLRFIEQTN